MLSVERLLDEARGEAGLGDFGGEDFLEPLSVLVDALNTEAGYNEFGEMRARISLARALVTRLQVHDYLYRHPDVLDQPVARPVFILGLPRTATTALHHLLNQDRRNHTLRLWEANNPVPPPEEATYLSDPRIVESREGVALSDQLMPGFRQAHLMDAEEPDECIMLFVRAMVSVEFPSFYHIPSYTQWIFDTPMSELYGYYKQQLQLLQYRKSGRWVLKTPMHQLGLDAIFEHFPDALIVQTHRDPATLLASGCSFCEILRNSCSDDVDPRVVGSDWLQLLETYTRRAEQARARLEPQHPEQFIDIFHDEFVADPLAAIGAIYERLGQAIDAEAESAMGHWIAAHPQHRHGRRSYSLERYGLGPEDVERVFGDYVRRYDLPTREEEGI